MKNNASFTLTEKAIIMRCKREERCVIILMFTDVYPGLIDSQMVNLSPSNGDLNYQSKVSG